jgi:hypothetical protein
MVCLGCFASRFQQHGNRAYGEETCWDSRFDYDRRAQAFHNQQLGSSSRAQRYPENANGIFHGLRGDSKEVLKYADAASIGQLLQGEHSPNMHGLHIVT